MTEPDETGRDAIPDDTIVDEETVPGDVTPDEEAVDGTSPLAARPRPSPFPRKSVSDEAGDSPDATDDRDEDADQARPKPRKRLHGWLIAATLVICLALVAVGAMAGFALWRGHEQDLDRAAAADAARAEVTNILTIDPKTVDVDVQHIIDGSTGAFKTDFTSRKDVFADVVKEQNVSSTSDIRSIGVESSTVSQASVLVAATSTVTNTASSGQPQPRDYRIRVQLDKEAGHWLASQIEFVP
ncbi:hypothetical protein LWP59_05815 [Amycolatopsis acidiphila]|uniref:Mce protein n=1 Tax=Amycolatopsis acidiphila TaxID=715473 RepID=A0A558AHW6_9PSEU|nr:hypothetical protein [Amycolatopsis acidiphila]TVT23864.1 hypothetical protein FNH06_08335 [Amycolatopsis acidiphila]UIJ61161.1 hypothetical protein LWP59_05815 [Amycolatopsis acidiphila]GHG86364.1 hypothetical protein GCM10017788_59410 [Amycolatopsis acidiphila]